MDSSIFNHFQCTSSDKITINRKDFELVQGYLRKVLELMENLDKNEENHQEMSQDLNQTTPEDISKDNDEGSQSFAEDFKREVEESDCIQIYDRSEVQEEDPVDQSAISNPTIINIFKEEAWESSDREDELLNEIFPDDPGETPIVQFPLNFTPSTSQNLFKCHLCPFTHHLNKALSIHFRTVHKMERRKNFKHLHADGSRKVKECSECGRNVAASYYSTHRENHNLVRDGMNLKCTLCGYISPSCDGIRKHINKRHKGAKVGESYTKIKAKAKNLKKE